MRVSKLIKMNCTVQVKAPSKIKLKVSMLLNQKRRFTGWTIRSPLD